MERPPIFTRRRNMLTTSSIHRPLAEPASFLSYMDGGVPGIGIHTSQRNRSNKRYSRTGKPASIPTRTCDTNGSYIRVLVRATTWPSGSHELVSGIRPEVELSRCYALLGESVRANVPADGGDDEKRMRIGQLIARWGIYYDPNAKFPHNT